MCASKMGLSFSTESDVSRLRRKHCGDTRQQRYNCKANKVHVAKL